MLVVDLACSHGHRFEGWFASSDDLTSQRERGLLSCPVCGDAAVERVPSASRLNVSGAREAEAPPGPPAQEAASSGAAIGPAELDVHARVQTAWLKVVRQVLASTEDVGERFADEARKIHQGDAPERAIRGQATAEEKEALRDEGIEVLSLVVPDALKQPLQ